MTVFRPNEAPAGPPLTEREREVLDLIARRRDEPRDRRAALPLAAHGQGAHVVAVPQAVGAQPGRGGAEGAAARAHRVSVIGLGLAALGRPGYINLGHGDDVGATRASTAMERAAHAVLDAAYAARRALLRRRPLLRPRGGVPRRAGCARAGCAATRSSSARSGATPTPPAGGSTPSTHEVKELSARAAAAPVGRDARRCSATACGSTRSTRRRSRAACSTTPRCSASSPRCAPPACAIGLTRDRAGQAATIDRGASTVGGFDAVQATWNLHERSAGPALARAARRRAGRLSSRRRWPTAGSTARGAPPALARGGRARGDDAPTRSRSPRRSRSRGPTSCSAAPRRSRSSRATWRARDVAWDGGLDESRGGAPTTYWATRSALAWN